MSNRNTRTIDADKLQQEMMAIMDDEKLVTEKDMLEYAKGMYPELDPHLLKNYFEALEKNLQAKEELDKEVCQEIGFLNVLDGVIHTEKNKELCAKMTEDLERLDAILEQNNPLPLYEQCQLPIPGTNVESGIIKMAYPTIERDIIQLLRSSSDPLTPKTVFYRLLNLGNLEYGSLLRSDGKCKTTVRNRLARMARNHIIEHIPHNNAYTVKV